MSLTFHQSLELAVAAPVITALSLLAAARLNAWFSDRAQQRQLMITERHKQLDLETAQRSRLLDLHKIIYPEKVKAATAIMNKAGTVFQDLIAWHVGAKEQKSIDEITMLVDELLWLSKAHEALLSPEVLSVVVDFRMDCIRFFIVPAGNKAISDDNVWAHQVNYDRLVNELRKVLYLDILDSQLRPPI